MKSLFGERGYWINSANKPIKITNMSSSYIVGAMEVIDKKIIHEFMKNPHFVTPETWKEKLEELSIELNLRQKKNKRLTR